MDLNLLHKFFANQTTLQEEEIIRIWLTASPENEKLFLEERKLHDAIILNSHQALVDAVTTQNMSAKANTKKMSVRLSEFLKIAATVLITLISCWLYYSYIESNDATAMQTITVPPGQHINLILPDGTNVWLNAKTTIKYPITFNRKKRSVYLYGEAFFDVAKNPEVPFIVMTEKGSVRALGTKFDVMAYAGSDKFETALMEGSVKLELSEDPSQSLILSPNNKSFVKDGKLQSTNIEDYSPYQWKEGLISFKDESFENIMKAFEKTYDVKIEVENKKLKNGLLFTGKFRMVDGVDYALRVLQKDVNFEYSRNKDNNIILIK